MANILNGHSSRGFVIMQTKIVDDLIERGKIIQAKKIIDDLIEDYPNDKFVLQRLGQLNLYFGNYEDALKAYLKLDEKASMLKLAFLGLKLHDMELLEKLYYDYFGNPCFQYEKKKTYGVFMYMKCYLDGLFGVEKSRNNYSFYETKQIIQFKKQEAIDHIIEVYQTGTNHNKSKFDPSLDISSLFEDITKLIEQNMDKSQFKDYNEYYVIKYPNVGFYKDSLSNYIHVNTLIGTSNIFTMYPARYSNSPNILELPKDEYSTNRMVKKLSNIEKFKQKYGEKY